MSEPLRIVTFAGSDSSGCAGLQADLRTIHSLGLHGLSVTTAVTAQTAKKVAALEPVSAATVTAQFQAALEVGFAAGKTGLLPGADSIRLVSELWEGQPSLPLVVDPVMASSSGRPFLDSAARRILRTHLFPLAAVVAPNRPEAEWLVGRALAHPDELEQAALEIQSWGAATVVIKGGHTPRQEKIRDLVLTPEGTYWLSDSRIQTRNSRGTGCLLSAAIAAFLAMGRAPLQAVIEARQRVRAGLRGYSLNNGPGPAVPGPGRIPG